MASKALSVPVDEVTEYMVIDYIQSLNSYKVEGAQTEQELEGRYSKFRYFVEDLRDEIEKQGVQSEVVNVKDVKADNSVQLTGLAFGYYLVDEITDVERDTLCRISLYGEYSKPNGRNADQIRLSKCDQKNPGG